MKMQLIGVDFAQFLQLFQRRSGRNAGLGEKLLQNWRDWLFLFGSRDEFSRKIKWRIGTNTGDSDGVVFQHANCTLYKSAQMAVFQIANGNGFICADAKPFSGVTVHAAVDIHADGIRGGLVDLFHPFVQIRAKRSLKAGAQETVYQDICLRKIHFSHDGNA